MMSWQAYFGAGLFGVALLALLCLCAVIYLDGGRPEPDPQDDGEP